MRYGFKYSIPAYLGVVYVGWSRVDSNKHDYTDVAAGALIGMFSSYYFASPYKNQVITPVADSKNIGVNLSYKW